MTDTIFLEVCRSNKAILSYFLELPTTQSSEVDYVQATTVELAYLSALEDEILPVGTVATLDDLTSHRTRVQAALRFTTTAAVNAISKPPQPFSKAAGKPTNPTPKPRDENAREALLRQLKQYRSTK